MRFLKPAVFENGIFQNPVPTEVGATKHFPQMLRRLLTGKEERVPRRPLGPFHTDPATFLQPPASGLRITWMGHSCLLLELDGTTLLIDPLWSERASMVQSFGPKRFFAPPLAMRELPPIDAVLLSHDHYDHLDKAAVLHLQERVPLFVCSMGVGGILQQWGVPAAKIHEVQWMDEFTVTAPTKDALTITAPTKDALTITALPARHFSGRSFKRYGTLWSSFVLKTPKHTMYHGADSGYWEGFREIGEAYGPFDLATLEIGAFDPLWDEIHLGPDNALKAAQDLKAKVLMPIHWGLFNLAFHDWFQPAERITEIAANANQPLWMPTPGQPTEFTGESLLTRWWQQYRTRATTPNEHAEEGASKVAIRV